MIRKLNKVDNHGMSLIDFLVMAIVFVTTVAILWNSASKYEVSTIWIAVIGVFVLNGIYMFFLHLREKKELKQEYLDGKIDKEYYLYRVGVKYFKKHHSEDE